MARGTEAKEIIKNRILETFEGSFLNDGGKEIRIPIMEDGSLCQIKVTLTCAKTNVENPEAGSCESSENSAIMPSNNNTAESEIVINGPTPEEKKAVADLCKKLGLVE